ncbi:MAG: hypothetical protein WBG50_25055, partial [Desulfomonilaceae bacterium]
ASTICSLPQFIFPTQLGRAVNDYLEEEKQMMKEQSFGASSNKASGLKVIDWPKVRCERRGYWSLPLRRHYIPKKNGKLSVAEFVGNPSKNGGLTAEGTMSFSLWPWLAEASQKASTRSGCLPNRVGCNHCNPRTIRCSGCTPAEPYPPNRRTK